MFPTMLKLGQNRNFTQDIKEIYVVACQLLSGQHQSESKKGNSTKHNVNKTEINLPN